MKLETADFTLNSKTSKVTLQTMIQCVSKFHGTAYVKGYDIDLVGSTVIDVPNQEQQEVKSARVPFAMGSLLKVNN